MGWAQTMRAHKYIKLIQIIKWTQVLINNLIQICDFILNKHSSRKNYNLITTQINYYQLNIKVIHWWQVAF